MTRNEIMSVLKGDYNAFSEMGFEIFGIFLFGSQNYGLEREGSDIDVKLIYVHKPDSEKEYFNGYLREGIPGQVFLLSIEDFLKELDTGYATWYEILYTNYSLISPKYHPVWQKISSLRDVLVEQTLKKRLEAELRYAEEELVVSVLGEKTKERENKRVMHVKRCENQRNRLSKGERYPSLLTLSPSFHKELMELKEESPLEIPECAKEIAKICIRSRNELKKKLKKGFPNESTEAYNKISQLLLGLKEEGDESTI